VAEQLKKDPSVEAILYVGAAGHLEEKLAVEHGLEFIGLSVSGLPRRLSKKMITWPFESLRAVQAAFGTVERFNPTMILGTGGYASAPPLVVAFVNGLPFAIHEPDAHPGLVNRLFASRAKLISLGMAAAADRIGGAKSKMAVNGNPVSNRFLNLPSRESALAELGLAPDRRTILVTGGSQGAQALNEAVYEMLPLIVASRAPVQILHQVGEKNWQQMESSLGADWLSSAVYKPRKYFDNLEVAYAVADITVCRAGAMTIAELFVTGTPAIFVPYPFGAQDHQTYNARSVESLGGAKVIPQSELNGRALFTTLKEILSDNARLATMKRQMLSQAKPNAAAELCGQLLRLSSEAVT
jgi:UDP-N-acetylglucosamine--N-acetylmuramyl-(pentapeptide) pyrophosphoryl-undecaprenol N-acetylglucosamine transferase